MAKLVCLSGMNKGQEFAIKEGDTTLGRSDANDICVFDKKSSRHHCKIEKSGEDLVIEDLNSTNGVRLNNAFISGRHPLKSGDHIKIGQTVFLVSARPLADYTTTESANMTPSGTIPVDKIQFRGSETTALRREAAEAQGGAAGYLAFFEVAEAEGGGDDAAPGPGDGGEGQ